MDLHKYLQVMVKHEASDLFFSAGAPVGIKIHGKTRFLGEHRLSSAESRQLAFSVLTDKQSAEFEREMELNLALAMDGIGRFRVNVFRQRGSVAMVVRHIKADIPSIEALNLPIKLKELVMAPRGLVLVVGSTGSGKSTTLASMIDYRNECRSGHILTIEDPIEFLHSHKKCIVDQREVGLDTHSYASALKNAMREAPDVILIGEIRDRDTMQHAIAYAETGHLCLSTLHANNANQALDRIINFFPESAHQQLFVDLSLHLQSIISQRLVPSVDGLRVPAVELLVRTPFVADLILKSEISGLKDAMKEGSQHGMQTFDQSLFELYKAGKITAEDALEHADSRNDLGLNIRLHAGAGNPSGDWDLQDS
ncbi:MAG: PilT/PilU family type 4a pilus ATPase [Wenzhouxiangella sp.]|nr:PilT/PilU family type 4a pilus ATPase [Wenzhouxiangella sp.]MCH8479621.1 PilT/PilU family type 4a pilus ATPase [Wenzhouxiangella sp.]TVR96245.1 MAG: PilT/PilU family type 4a pilus ATPase [Wenzhouxiangellaceae bacterium]